MARKNGLTEMQLRNRVKKYNELEAEIKALEEMRDALKEEMKADLEAKGVESAAAGPWVVYYQTTPNNRFDTKNFKIDHKALYDAYFKVGTTKKFRIGAA